jgi:chromosomal replication initiator protein
MTSEIGIWNQIIESLTLKFTRSEIKTWFSHTTCNRIDNNLAVIEVPNKFVANWLKDNYLKDINRSFKKILKETPEIHFKYIKKESIPLSQKLHKKEKNIIPFENNLNKSMNFDNYITGDFNIFAYSSAIEVSNRPGNYYNPFYIFSTLSIGKTHLLNAIGNHILKKDRSQKVCYIYSNKFISEFNYFLKNKNLNEFKKKYHNIDILLFDDIQDLANNSKLQEAFLYIFNDIYGENKQIVITGDRPPNRLKDINAQLKSRLGWGLLAEVKEFDYKIKYNIIKNKIKENNINIPNDIISLLVKSNSNVKVLLKNIIRIKTYLSLNNNINISLLKSLIKERGDTNIEVKDIQSITAKYFNISVSDIISDKKKKIYSYPRHLAMYLSRKHTDLSFQEIGFLFGDRDHTTVIYALKKIDKIRNLKKDIKNDINNIENLINYPALSYGVSDVKLDLIRHPV